jgi:hypothetical protein
MVNAAALFRSAVLVEGIEFSGVKYNGLRTHYDRFFSVCRKNDIDNISIDIDNISCFNGQTSATGKISAAGVGPRDDPKHS